MTQLKSPLIDKAKSRPLRNAIKDLSRSGDKLGLCVSKSPNSEMSAVITNTLISESIKRIIEFTSTLCLIGISKSPNVVKIKRNTVNA